jgi:hypothetical protein
MSKEYTPQAPAVVTIHKSGLNEHKLDLPGRMRGAAVVELEMLELKETRWRLRTPSGNEARITEATLPHTQETRNRKVPGLYIMEKGWGACCTVENDFVRVALAFANTENFYLHVPARIDYVVRFSGPTVFTFASPDKVASSPVKDSLYETVANFSEETLLSSYAEQHDMSVAELARLVTASKTA